MRIVVDLQGAQTDTSRFRGVGRYSLAFTQALVRTARNHEVWIALNGAFEQTIEPIRAGFDHLVPQSQIVVFDVPGPIAEVDRANYRRVRSAEHLREHFLASLKPDVTLISSLFEGQFTNAVTSVGTFVRSGLSAVILYDLIPLLYEEAYLYDSGMRNWYFRKLDSLKRADLLCAISQCTRRDAVNALSIPDERIVNILGAVDERFRRLKITPDEIDGIRAKFGLNKPFIMCTGGIDYRKNVEGLIRAYALCSAQLRETHRLAIVCGIPEEDRARLEALAAGTGLGRDEIVFTGFVTDREMATLYNLCALFVFPSLYEGFGLPVLEAMRCGAAVIGSNASSIPEVVGRDDALFDPTRPQAMAEKITEALTNRGFHQSLCEYGPIQSKKFSWEETSRRALAALEEAHAQRYEEGRIVAAVPRYRSKMAYISPLPPEPTGIADYSADLLPELSRHYDIEVVVDRKEVSDSWIRANFPIRSSEWFDRHADRFERVVYHVGDSSFHGYQFDLLEKHKGVVVLHDFFLSDLNSYIDRYMDRPGWFTESLLDSHGYSALIALGQNPHAVTCPYPGNKPVLDEAAGVIVHSQTFKQWAEDYYGENYTSDWHVVPSLRGLPHPIHRRSARDELGLDAGVFLVCSFGVRGSTKHNHSLLEAWLASPVAGNQGCRLVFVGATDSGEYGLQLTKRIEESGLTDRLKITGRASPELFRNYLAAADMAVQLQSPSRGDTSRIILDCLAHGLPLVTNSHGQAGELPEGVAVKLPGQSTVKDLSSAITSLWRNKTARERLARSALKYIRERHSPVRVGELYRDAIESVYEHGSFARYRRLISRLSCIYSCDNSPSSSDIIQVAQTVAANQPRRSFPQLLIDISELARKDAKTGIQRVVRSVLRELIVHPPANWRIEPVYYDGKAYRYAGNFTLDFVNCPQPTRRDEILVPKAGDIYLGIDLLPDIVPAEEPLYAEWRNRGVRTYFVVYDLLPILRPDTFPPGSADWLGAWLASVSRVADGLLCISRAVADEVMQILDRLQPPRMRDLNIGFFHLGADIAESTPTTGMVTDAEAVFAKIRSHPSFLMVGNIEPRKGHRQTLAAFERLWAEGLGVNLVIAGKIGWMVDSLARNLRNHDEQGNRLIWLDRCSDEMLMRLYEECTALLMASEGEGFGLPLIEAAHHKLPIIARDLPVFQEVAGEHVYYFHGMEPQDLAAAIREWIRLQRSGTIPGSSEMPRLTWKQSTARLLDVILGEEWYAKWTPETRAR